VLLDPPPLESGAAALHARRRQRSTARILPPEARGRQPAPSPVAAPRGRRPPGV